MKSYKQKPAKDRKNDDPILAFRVIEGIGNRCENPNGILLMGKSII